MHVPPATRPRTTYYLVICDDAPGAAGPRAAALHEHLAHVEAHLDRIALAGPRTDGSRPIDGSIFVLSASDPEDALALVRSDPYARAGVWSALHVHPLKAACGSLIGGVTW